MERPWGLRSKKEKETRIKASKDDLRKALTNAGLALGALGASHALEAKAGESVPYPVPAIESINKASVVLDQRLLMPKFNKKAASIQAAFENPSRTAADFINALVESRDYADAFSAGKLVDGVFIPHSHQHVKLPDGLYPTFLNGARGSNATVLVEKKLGGQTKLQAVNFTVRHNPFLPKNYRGIVDDDLAVDESPEISPDKKLIKLGHLQAGRPSITIGSDGKYSDQYVGVPVAAELLLNAKDRAGNLLIRLGYSSIGTEFGHVNFEKVMTTPGIYCKVLPQFVDLPGSPGVLLRSGTMEVQVTEDGEVKAVGMQSVHFEANLKIDGKNGKGPKEEVFNFLCFIGADRMRGSITGGGF